MAAAASDSRTTGLGASGAAGFSSGATGAVATRAQPSQRWRARSRPHGSEGWKLRSPLRAGRFGQPDFRRRRLRRTEPPRLSRTVEREHRTIEPHHQPALRRARMTHRPNCDCAVIDLDQSLIALPRNGERRAVCRDARVPDLDRKDLAVRSRSHVGVNRSANERDRHRAGTFRGGPFRRADSGDSVKLTTPARWYDSGSAPDSAALRGIESPPDSRAEVSWPKRFASTPAGDRVERGADTSATAAAAAERNRPRRSGAPRHVDAMIGQRCGRRRGRLCRSLLDVRKHAPLDAIPIDLGHRELGRFTGERTKRERCGFGIANAQGASSTALLAISTLSSPLRAKALANEARVGSSWSISESSRRA